MRHVQYSSTERSAFSGTDLQSLQISILINVQRDATICSLYFILMQNHSTCFGCRPHPSSGVHKTVVTSTGTSHMFVQLPHSNVAKLILPRWSELAARTYDLYQWL